MAHLRSEPGEAIASREDLMALAARLEQDAFARYRAMAAGFARGEAPEVARVLEDLSNRAERRMRGFVAASDHASPVAPPRAPPAGVFDDEGLESANPALVSPYRVLSMAVRNEERAFAFWSYLAAHARTPDIRMAAEALAHGELEQVADLRRERRRAYRVERGQLNSALPAAALAEAEKRLLAKLEHRVAEASGPDRDRLTELLKHGRDNLVTLDRLPEMESAAAVSMPPDVDDVAMAEFLLEAYLDVADRSQDEEAVRQAQSMAGRAISRLTWLRQHREGQVQDKRGG